MMDKLNNNEIVTRPGHTRTRQWPTWALMPILLIALVMPAWADEITLNLKDADIRALISTVSKFTGKNFIIDPRVKAMHRQ